MYNDIEQDEGTPVFCSDFARLGHESIEITYKTYSHFLPGDDDGSSEDWGEKSGRAEGTSSACFPLPDSHFLPWLTATILPQAPKQAATTRKRPAS